MGRVPIYHTGCGKPAFEMTQMPVMGEALRADEAWHLNGEPMIPNTLLSCDSCHQAMGMDELYTEKEA